MQEELGRTAVVADLRKLFVEAVSQTSSDLIINSNFELQFRFLEPNPLFFLDTSNPHEQYLRVNSRVNREAVCSSEQVCCSTSIGFNEYNKQSTVIDVKPCVIVLLLLVDLIDIRNRQNSFKESILQINLYVLDINDNAPEWSAHESLTISAQHVDKNSIIYRKLLELNKPIPKLDLTITEHTEIGTRIALPQAADPDARPENTTSIYGIYGQTTNEAFSLDWDTVPTNTDSTSHNTGSGLWLRINMDLDYENRSVHEVLIYASDGGKPSPLTGYLFINITVTDINDHPPLFFKKFDEIWIKEHSPVRTQIYRPIVTDKDVTDRSRLKFGFSPSILAETKQLFQIDKMTGSISIYGQVDFEHIHKHRIPIFVTDGKWTDESELIVNVVNLNDHVPKIQLHSPLKFKQNDRSFYFGSTLGDSLQNSRFHLTIFIKENGPPDQLVATVTVTDKDLTAELRARELNYASSVKEMPVVFSQRSLIKSSPEMNDSQNFRRPQILEPVCKVNHKAFQINPLQNVMIMMITMVDIPLMQEVTKLCYIYQNTKGIRRRLFVIVADENDCPPVIKGPLTGTLEEAAPIDTVVLKLSADDADDPTTNAGNLGLRYTLLGHGQPQFTVNKQENSDEDESLKLRNLNLPPQPWFQLNSVSGELKALVIFDREMIKSISLPIEVRDGGDNIKERSNLFIENSTTKVNSINATITIDIIDVNDCIPSFTQQIYEFNISEDARPPIRIGKIEAYDCDIDEINRNLNYWLQSVQHPMLTEKSNLPTEKDYFIKNTSYISAHSTLTNWFSISKSGDLYFRMPQINSQLNGPGFIDPLMPLDREKLELIIMDLFIKDSGKPSLTGSAQIVLRILDVNDNAPEWEFPKVQQRMINLSTDAAVGHRIVQIFDLAT
ncbi:LOW QUALITY PROTEIN: putative cadherin [Schistosoma mansoni]|uniref:putative cadherin n=1 Tax=Schistosoma mansoni TaxID=6183 RepID=UPI00022DC31B|nr:LOW QUALITY PROTEIN: putative cadherin [Schistosoma mansoni]|eukprot:XP_018648645.1 LOW QUALITY PROTEIN: putative cadherin [Schistosoma mansoni]